MNIGFFSTGSGPHNDVAQHMLASVEKHMPDIPVFHLTDDVTPALATPIRLAEPKPLALKRAKFYASLRGDWLFIDTDIVFTRDVRSVFDQDFEVAFARRTEVNQYTTAMPYNLGVCFSRNPHFWADLIDAISKLPPKLQEWDGAQLASSWYATRNWCPYKILELDPEYNHAPENEVDTNAAILHYKGKRKRWLGHPIKSIRPAF